MIARLAAGTSRLANGCGPAPGGTRRPSWCKRTSRRPSGMDRGGRADPDERQRREESDRFAYQDADGRFFDFHSLRGQFISAMENAGVSLKTLQALARHSRVETTLKHYARVQLADVRGRPRRPAGPAGGKAAGSAPRDRHGPAPMGKRVLASCLALSERFQGTSGRLWWTARRRAGEAEGQKTP